MNIDQIRKDTPGCEQVIHFNNAGAALMPASVARTVRDYITEEEQLGGYELAEREWNNLHHFYDLAGELLHCKSKNIAYTTNATDGYNRALSSIQFKEGDVVLVSGNDYPSNFIAFISLQKRLGIQLVRIANTVSGELDLQDLEEKVKTLSPRLVSVTHVPTSSGLVQPVEAVGQVLKNYDTLYLLDACQSVGQMALDAVATQADFISGTFRKFLRGPRGAGFLYVSDRALEKGLEPLYIDLRGAEWIAENEYRPQSGAGRFEDWETAYALMAGSREALSYLLSIGIENVKERNDLLVSRLRAGLAEVPGIHLQDRGLNPCSIVTFSLQHRLAGETKRFFRERGINIYTTPKSSAVLDFNEKGVDWVARVSPHYYNTVEEIDRFIEVAKEL